MSVPATQTGPSQAEPVVSALRASVPNALTAFEMTALSAWLDVETGYGFGFNTVAERSGIDRSKVRRVVRALARKGAVEYSRSLFWEDSGKMGAGYSLTSKGESILRGYHETL